MKIYELFSWPVKDNIPQKPKRYFFTNIKAANKFIEFLNKIEPDHPHYATELTAYDQCNDNIDGVLLASKDNEGLIVHPDNNDIEMRHDCHYCNYRHSMCEYGNARNEDMVKKYNEDNDIPKEHYFEFLNEYSKRYPCEHFEIGKCMICPWNDTDNEECKSHQATFDWEGCDNYSKALSYARRKKHYEKYKEQISKRYQKYYQNNKEKYREQNKKYEEEHKEEIKLYKQKWFQENKERINAKKREERRMKKEKEKNK